MTVSRKSLVIAALAWPFFAAFAGAAPCDLANFSYTPSEFKLDYRKKIPSPIAEIISQGEAEYLAAVGADKPNFTKAIRRDTRKLWTSAVNRLFDATLSDSFTGAADEPSFDTFRYLAPVMLARLKACGPAVDPRLGYLYGLELEPSSGDVE